jgi:hypothetical protein
MEEIRLVQNRSFIVRLKRELSASLDPTPIKVAEEMTLEQIRQQRPDLLSQAEALLRANP